MSDVLHLTVDAVLGIHAEVLAAHGGADGIRDHSLLESAVSAPQATMLGEPLITDPIEIGAAYLFYICKNHPFIDGNKRTALASCLVFLSVNGYLAVGPLDLALWESLTLDVASGAIDRAEATERLRLLVKR
jgi:death-on-curing protein